MASQGATPRWPRTFVVIIIPKVQDLVLHVIKKKEKGEKKENSLYSYIFRCVCVCVCVFVCLSMYVLCGYISVTA